ncbi:hypothetical protein Q787_10800 [Ornithobacterium rhinotracheale H06-030791]|nr:hypothetical protein Q787_10800 [Ornithobacterium rhinotracheale H06-030791]
MLAPVLVLALTPLNVAIVFAKDCRKKGFKTAFQGMADYFRESAYRWDCFGCSELRTLKTKQGKEFGKRGLSLSSDLGMQEKAGTMSRTGAVLNALLFLIERNHCRKAYENDELKQKINN